MKKLYLVLFLLLPLLGHAQRKTTMPLALWPELQLSYGVGENGLLFLQNHYRINTDSRYNAVAEDGLLSHFERVQLALGYEQAFTDHWRSGAIVRYAAENQRKNTFTTAYVRHTGYIKTLFFNKQVMLEYATETRRDPYVRFRMMAELGKRLPLGQRFITPSLLYELLVNKQLEEEDPGVEKRTIDRTRLRLNLTYEVTGKLGVTSYLTRQTEYHYVQGSYDENNQLVKPGGNFNKVQPVVGLELKYTLNSLPTVVGSYTY